MDERCPRCGGVVVWWCGGVVVRWCVRDSKDDELLRDGRSANSCGCLLKQQDKDKHAGRTNT